MRLRLSSRTDGERSAESLTSRPVGLLLREHRKNRKLSLNDLSVRTGITPSTLSRIETGRIAATFDRISAIAAGMDLALPELFAGERPGNRGEVPRAHARRAVSRGRNRKKVYSAHYEYQTLCWELQDQSIFPIVARLLCRTLNEFGPLVRHEGQEFVYVLSGRARIVTDQYEDTVLEVGDAMYIDSTMGHAILNACDDKESYILGGATTKRPIGP